MDFGGQIRTEDELRALYRDPSDIVKGKVADHLNDAAQGFVAASPFVLLATSDAGEAVRNGLERGYAADLANDLPG
jgi:predicted pyridoxine 5'-phosphate oxidase superfamily flavin-nucleotide-binding protein